MSISPYYYKVFTTVILKTMLFFHIGDFLKGGLLVLCFTKKIVYINCYHFTKENTLALEKLESLNFRV